MLQYHSREDFGVFFFEKLRAKSPKSSEFQNLVFAWSLLAIYMPRALKSCKVVKFESPGVAVE